MRSSLYPRIITVVALAHALLFLSCAKLGGSRPVSAHDQAQTMTDVIAVNLVGPVAFQDTQAIKASLASLSSSDTDCAVVLSATGAPLTRYDKTKAAIGSDRLVTHLKKTFPKLQSAYAADLNAYVAVSPVKDGVNTIAYIALARK